MTRYERDLDRTMKALNNLVNRYEDSMSVGMGQAITMLQYFIQWEFENIKVQKSLEKSLDDLKGEESKSNE